MRRAFDQHKSSGPLPIILGAVIAFGIGLLGISGIVKMSVVPCRIDDHGGRSAGGSERKQGRSFNSVGLRPNGPRRDCAADQDLHSAAAPRHIARSEYRIGRNLSSALGRKLDVARGGGCRHQAEGDRRRRIRRDLGGSRRLHLSAERLGIVRSRQSRTGGGSGKCLLAAALRRGKSGKARREGRRKIDAAGHEPRLCAAECTIGQGPRHGRRAPSGFRRPPDCLGFRHVRSGRVAAGRTRRRANGASSATVATNFAETL